MVHDLLAPDGALFVGRAFSNSNSTTQMSAQAANFKTLIASELINAPPNRLTV
jgi:hypothetical protein